MMLLDDQVVAGPRERGQAGVEPREESRAHLAPPVERAVILASARQHSCVDEAIRRDVQERLVERFLQCDGKR